MLLKYLSIKDGLKLSRSHYCLSVILASKVPVHKRWIETETKNAAAIDAIKLLKYLSIKDGLKPRKKGVYNIDQYSF